MQAVKIFKVIKKNLFHKKYDKTYTSYVYWSEGHDWNATEVNEHDKIAFTFSNNMNAEDIVKINNKWKHKLINGVDYENMGGLHA